MTAFAWQPKQIIEAVMFDCDSTLSRIEGITELARKNGVLNEVNELTEKAMNETGMNVELYQRRLELVQPTQHEISQLGDLYHITLTPAVDQLIRCLKRLGKSIYIVSAGIKQGVDDFAKKLGIPTEHVFAVSVSFNSDGSYRDFDHHSPLARRDGKKEIATMLLKKHQTLAHIGDGMNDAEAIPVVDRFIGYGGVCFRKNVAEISPYFISSLSIMPVLPLLLTKREIIQLNDEEHQWYHEGLCLINSGDVSMIVAS